MRKGSFSDRRVAPGPRPLDAAGLGELLVLATAAKAALEAFIFEGFRPRPFNTHLSLVLDTLTSIQERLADLDQDTRHDAE